MAIFTFMKKYKDISPHQYAKWKGCKVQYIHKLLLDGKIDKLPFVKEVKKYSRFYTLKVPDNLTADSFKIIATKQ